MADGVGCDCPRSSVGVSLYEEPAVIGSAEAALYIGRSERFMSISLRRQNGLWFLSIIVAGIAIVGCSRDADRSRTSETAASTAAVDSGTPPVQATADSPATPAVNPQDTSKAPSPAPKPPAKRATSIPKPSIDPGRLPPKARTESTAASTKAGSDSGSDSSSTASNQSTGAATQGQPLKYDAATNTATFELRAGPFNWNGFSNGTATLVLPPKANVVINFVNKDGTPHSAEVISGEGPIPNASTDPAIPRAYTNKALEGLPQEATDVMRFTVPESGSYRIFCGVPGHGLSGMWIWMKVDPAAKAASFGPTKS